MQKKLSNGYFLKEGLEGGKKNPQILRTKANYLKILHVRLEKDNLTSL